MSKQLGLDFSTICSTFMARKSAQRQRSWYDPKIIDSRIQPKLVICVDEDAVLVHTANVDHHDFAPSYSVPLLVDAQRLEEFVKGRCPIPSSWSKMAPTAQSLASIVNTTESADPIARSAVALIKSF